MRRGQEGKRQNGREKHLSRGSQLVLIYTGHQAVTKQNPILISSVRYQNKVHEKPFMSTIKRYIVSNFSFKKKKSSFLNGNFGKERKRRCMRSQGETKWSIWTGDGWSVALTVGFLPSLRTVFLRKTPWTVTAPG